MLRSRKAFYDALPIFLTAFPIGLLADLYSLYFYCILPILAGYSTHESRRTQSFFYLYSIYLVCELLAPMIALVAMENHPKSRLRNRRPPSCVSPGL
ncbi:hypothetical protein P8C59_008329 [Phyllachora maydis]|uniref:Uncharacterized protein n=1 Tax=Phyllachora maydis TaxID=1825666 RepID=A0AAD9IAX4_9PEZI|nr:hypothetical protein P8C59_008329 [Phyllachora maydis]